MPMRSSSPNHQSPIANSNEGCLNSSFLEVVGDVGESDTVSRDARARTQFQARFSAVGRVSLFLFPLGLRARAALRPRRSKRAALDRWREEDVNPACHCRVRARPLSTLWAPTPTAARWILVLAGCRALSRIRDSSNLQLANWPTGPDVLKGAGSERLAEAPKLTPIGQNLRKRVTRLHLVP